MTTTDTHPATATSFTKTAPFWMSLLTVPLALMGAIHGGLWVAILPVFTWGLFSVLDAVAGTYEVNADPQTGDDDLFWYRLLTILWFPVQACLTFFLVWYVPGAAHLGLLEKVVLFFGVGVIAGTIGIVYAHELMHQKNRLERWMGDLLMTITLYGHFRSEHLLVHHRYVGTPRDPVSARYNEGFYVFLPRVLRECLVSAWKAEAAMLARRQRAWWHRSNPFWRYGLLQSAFLGLAFALGGWIGLGLFVFQAIVAIWQLELVNYIEHYGLTRKHLGDGKYEHVQPRHSWNANQLASNWLLINLQRHSDHHYKPDRRFPLLQARGPQEAPQMPYGYPVMTGLAMIPALWRRVMNPRVADWQRAHYPEIEDWAPYRDGSLPRPR
ncbi:alkane 1-monooxygenase [Actibacterium sp. 188UL27-1]|uniref:alkane 1-monooxygenase n=1 Tax=Actibacterium sp. 188UL27-1 TaxID=2786961 RepID=UPI0019589C3A|nr:alkane 1-monooxygenase [Actibacterium sp. 188UL27-1]MBM7070160.1 alkane 1-monooxygenase [Actibacterium sp. 188UL27-1]